jgi:hypothetical protein
LRKGVKKVSCEAPTEIATSRKILKALSGELRYRTRQIVVYPAIRLKYLVIVLIRRNFPRPIHFGRETCFLCIHWCVCGKQVKGKGLFLRWSDGIEKFFRFSAESCDHWLQDPQILLEIEEQRSLKRVIRALKEGKAVAIHMDGKGPVDVLGIYRSVDEATFSINGDKDTFVLPRAGDRLPEHHPREQAS